MRTLPTLGGVILLVATVTAGATVAGTHVELQPWDQTVDVSEETTYSIRIPDVDGGVGAYTLTLSVRDPDVATITDARNEIGGTGRVQRIRGDVRMEYENTRTQSDFDVTIATVRVKGVGEGQTWIDLSVSDLRRNGGSRYVDVRPKDGRMTVEATSTPIPDTPTDTPDSETPEPVVPDVTNDGNQATDPDNDGVYEDVNGDGDLTPGDATVLFNAVFREQANVVMQPRFFDANGDGDVTAGDATVVFNEAF